MRGFFIEKKLLACYIRIMKSKLNVAVFIGEHKFWLAAASFIFSAADSKKYNLKPVFLNWGGIKIFNGYCPDFSNIPLEKIKIELTKLAEKIESINAAEGVEQLKKEGIDFGFVLTQKFQGGMKIQEFLDQAGIPYNGSHFKAAETAIDKNKVSQILQEKGFLLPKEISINLNQWLSDQEKFFQKIKDDFILPIIVKPASAGDSIGISVVNNSNQIIDAVNKAFVYDKSIIVQEYLKGLEVSCAVLDKGVGHLNILTPLMTQPLNNCWFFNSFSKKNVSRCQISKFSGPSFLVEKIKLFAAKAHQILNLAGISQTDFILVGEKIYFLEINPTQGFRPSSVFLRAIEIAGLKPRKLFDWMVQAGFNRFSNEKNGK